MTDSFGYGFDEDVQVYSFLDPETNDNLGALLDEGNFDDLNDDTFGDSLGSSNTGNVGRDFDFAGATNRLLAPADNAWTGGAAQAEVASHHLKSNQPQTQPQQPTAAQSSAWASLDADPLLSSAPLAPKRNMRTLDEIEAELRNQQQQPPAGPQPGRPLTLEEVEAQMLQQRQQQPQGPPPQFYNYGPPPPGYRGPPHPGMQGIPPQFQHQQMPFPPGQMPPHLMHQQGRPGGPPGPGGYGPPQQLGGPPSPFPQPQQIPGQPQQQPQPGQPQPGQSPSPAIAAQPHPQQAGPGGPPPMQTLFPPLPSQARPPTVEQQLQFLSIHGHAQHPSLTAAQLQAMLQQAQAQAGAAASAENAGQLPGEDLIRNVEARIREHELLEQGRKKKAAKIASMAKHNNVMSNSDKDFITRIQVSQLVTDDPYADDFYFHIMAALKQSAFMAQQQQQHPQPGFGPGGPMMGPGGPNGPNGPMRNNNQRKPTRQQNAMNKMAQNVQRLVDSAKQRQAKQPQLTADGALGKIALRTRSAPRQLLQVNAAAAAGAQSHSATALLAGLSAGTGTGAALSHRAALAILERIYDAVLDLEQLRRIQPGLVGTVNNIKAQKETAPEGALDEPLAAAEEAVAKWEADYAELSAKLWTELRVMEPLDSASPHPFVSLVAILKGKRILPRALRHLSPEQNLTLLTLVVATFDTLDTVVDAPALDAADGLEGKQKRAEVVARTEAFLNAIVAPVMSVIGNAPLRMVTGMLGLLMQRNDFKKVVRSKPGIAVLTIFLSRAESLKQATPAPEAVDLAQWQQAFTHLFNLIMSDLSSLFPSNRAISSSMPFGASYYLGAHSAAALLAQRPDIDSEDEPVWTLLAAVAVCADPNEQQNLVTGVRDKVLENVTAAKKGKLDQQTAALKIRNVNLLLHSLGLDASQLTVDE